MNVFSLLLSAALSAAAPPGVDWSRTFNSHILAISPEHSGDCFAALTQTELRVLTYDGRLLWTRNLKTLGKSYRGALVSLAPSCEWAAVAGDASYRYVWILEPIGQRFLALPRETPVSIAISPDGSRLAVATGMERLHLYDGLPSKPVERIMKTRRRLPRTQVFTGDGRYLLTTAGYASTLMTRDGEIVWEDAGGWCTTSPADSSDWFISVCVPNHGPGGATVTARDVSGRKLWQKYLPYATGAKGRLAPYAFLLVDDETADLKWLKIVTIEGDITLDQTAHRIMVGVNDDGTTVLYRIYDERAAWLLWCEARGDVLGKVELEGHPMIEPRRNLTRVIAFDGPVLRMLSR